MRIRTAILVLVCTIMTSCSVQKEIIYFQDTSSDGIEVPEPKPIRIKPGDKISVEVYSRDEQIEELMNIPALRKRIALRSDYESMFDVEYTQALGVSLYSVNQDGHIILPTLGRVHVGDMTREEASIAIKESILEAGLVQDAVVTVEFGNIFFYVLGEVSKPGRFSIDDDVTTIVDALSRAGDMTIYGRRDRILVKRQMDGIDTTIPVNMKTSEELFRSPAYYIQQNDIIYVEPNNMRKRDTTGTLNRWLSASFWVSVANVTLTAIKLFTK